MMSAAWILILMTTSLSRLFVLGRKCDTAEKKESQYSWGILFDKFDHDCTWELEEPIHNSALLVHVINIDGFSGIDRLNFSNGIELDQNNVDLSSDVIWCGWFFDNSLPCKLSNITLSICNERYNVTSWPLSVTKNDERFSLIILTNHQYCPPQPITTSETSTATTATYTTTTTASSATLTTTENSTTTDIPLTQTMSKSEQNGNQSQRNYVTNTAVIGALLGMTVVAILFMTYKIWQLRKKLNSEPLVTESTVYENADQVRYNTTDEQVYSVADPNTQGEEVNNELYQPLDEKRLSVVNELYNPDS